MVLTYFIAIITIILLNFYNLNLKINKMSLQSSFIEPLESTFNFNALLKFEKSKNKFYHLNKENNFEEEENSLNKDCYSSESFSKNLLSFQKELQRKNLFNPVPFESKKK